MKLFTMGRRDALTKPGSILVLREKQAWESVNGGWGQNLWFADGHSEVHRSAVTATLTPGKRTAHVFAAPPGQ